MKLIVYEWRKLLRLPTLWVFLGLCLGFNLLLIFGQAFPDRDFFNQVSATAEVLGQRMDPAFHRGLAAMPPTEHRDALLPAVAGAEDILEDYDTDILADFYADVVKSSPLAQKWMTWKYDLLASRVAHLAQTDAAMDLYAGPATHGSHQFLFGTLLRAVLCESGILAMLGTLYLLGYETMHRTQGLTCTTRTGRRLHWIKVLAALCASVGLYLILVTGSLIPYFLLYRYDGIWNASVSSQFNYLTDLLLTRPFLTWGDFTVGQYLLAFLALGAGLTAVFSLLAAVWGILMQNTYFGALGAGLLCFGGLGLTSLLGEAGLWVPYLISTLQPATLWLSCGGWFTELGLNAVLPWQETIGVGINYLFWGGAAAMALARFQRKDVA